MSLLSTDLRKDYQRARLLEEDAPSDPLLMFHEWLAEAIANNLREPNAMTLATATPDGRPSARMVLLKAADERGFSFFSNYESRKGAELAENPWAALCFWWGLLERQIRIEGQVEKLTDAESDAYYHARPLGSRLAALVSAQSQVIPNRQDLETRYYALEVEYADHMPERPAYWGGYLLRPSTIEFWQGGPFRLHDRLRYTKQENTAWLIERLSP